ncbi:DoxX family protein [Peribacillus muralis]|uniref:DoxX family protein n=1 Tax=Peribacillus muralis TaxID=264697 RepID=UPI003805C92E
MNNILHYNYGWKWISKIIIFYQMETLGFQHRKLSDSNVQHPYKKWTKKTEREYIIFWICTGLLVATMGIGSIPDIMSVPDAVELYTHLGYPSYLLPYLGIAKLLGIAAIFAPGFPRTKEAAYAGFTFDVSGPFMQVSLSAIQ